MDRNPFLPEYNVFVIWVNYNVEKETQKWHVCHVCIRNIIFKGLINPLHKFTSLLMHNPEFFYFICESSVVSNFHSGRGNQ